MTKQQQIREAFRKLAGEHGPLQSLLAEVVSVDEEEKTCVLKDDDGFEVFDVRLKPVLNANEGVTIFPKAGAWVLAIRIEDDEDWMIIAADDIDKYRIKVGDCEFEIKDGFLIQRDEDTLKQVLQLMIDATKKIVVMQGTNPDYAKLVQAQTKLNNLLR